MTTNSSEQQPNGSHRRPTVMYLIEIGSNESPCLVGDGLPLQMLNINQNNTHYLIPIQETNQVEVPERLQLHTEACLNMEIESNISCCEERPTVQTTVVNSDLQAKQTQITPSVIDRPEQIHISDICLEKNGSSSTEVAFKDNDMVIPQLEQSKTVDLKLAPESNANKSAQSYLHIADSVPPPRAVSSLPGVLRVRRGDRCVVTLKPLPPRVRFGPVQGVVQEISKENACDLVSKAAENMKPVFFLSNNYDISHIDVSDQDTSNWFSLLPLGDESTANVWLHQEGGQLYGVTTRSIAPRVRLALGYSRQYADRHRLPANQPVVDIDDEEDHRKWWCYECRLACKTAALLQRHMDVCHADFKTNTRRRLYRCNNCALAFSRFFTLKRHMSLHCKSKEKNKISKPAVESTEITSELFNDTAPPEEDRLPSDESFHNYTNSLDFSTNLFDTDRMSTLDISAHSRSELNFYGEKDDNYSPNQSGQDENVTDNVSPELSTKRSQKDKSMLTTCPHCQEIIPSPMKHRHARQCSARLQTCACGKTFRDRELLAKHVYAEHGNTTATTEPTSENDSNDRSYKCDQCRNVFKRRGMLVNHLWRVHGALARVPLQKRERHYPCGACPKMYRSAAKRDRHVQVHHPGAESMRAACIESGSVWCAAAACPACPRQYATRAKMLQHARARHPLMIPPTKK